VRIAVMPFFKLEPSSVITRLPPILLASILHHCRFADHYYVITDYDKVCFKDLFSVVGEKVTIVRLDEVISSATRLVIDKLVSLWSSGIAIANHPPSEKLCFLRWFAIRDWLNTLDSDASCHYLLHDWDDLAFRDPYESLEELRVYMNIENLDVASFTEVGLCQWMQPNLTFFSKNSIYDYCNTVEYFVDELGCMRSLNLKDKGFLDDCLPWAYLINRYRAFGDGIFVNLLFGGMENRKARFNGFRLYFNTTVRTPEDFDKINFKIPKEFDYTEDKMGLVELLRLDVFDGKVQARNAGEDRWYQLVNIHFTGVESKYAFLNGYLCNLRDYYTYNAELAHSLQACGLGCFFGLGK